MTLVTDNIERQILIVTSQEEALAPVVAVIKTILQQMPTMVEPKKAMASVNLRAYDLVIIDVHDCKEPLPLIRSFKEHFVHIPVIALVPYGNIHTVEQVLEYGADDYISQPISFERLKTTLRNALRMRSLLLGFDISKSSDLGYVGAKSYSLRILLDASGRLKTLREIEDTVIDHAIKSCDGCITQAARALGVGRSTLYRKMQEKLDVLRQTSRENQTTRPIMVASSMGDS